MLFTSINGIKISLKLSSLTKNYTISPEQMYQIKLLSKLKMLLISKENQS